MSDFDDAIERGEERLKRALAPFAWALVWVMMAPLLVAVGPILLFMWFLGRKR